MRSSTNAHRSPGSDDGQVVDETRTKVFFRRITPCGPHPNIDEDDNSLNYSQDPLLWIIKLSTSGGSYATIYRSSLERSCAKNKRPITEFTAASLNTKQINIEYSEIS